MNDVAAEYLPNPKDAHTAEPKPEAPGTAASLRAGAYEIGTDESMDAARPSSPSGPPVGTTETKPKPITPAPVTHGFDAKNRIWTEGIYVLHSSGRTQGTGWSFIALDMLKSQKSGYNLGGVGDTEQLSDRISQENQKAESKGHSKK